MSINPRFDVSDKTAIITGSSSGIGKTIAEVFADQGANVVVSSREQENVDPVADGINESDADGEALAIECDVRDRDAVGAMVEATVEEFGTVDTLVNNAGASFMADFEEISANGWKTIVDINLHGTFHCIQEAGEVMMDDGGGTVVNMASMAGVRGSPQMSHYGAAKAAVINLTTTLSYEWAEHDVRVNCIAPGFVATPGVASQMGVTADEIDRDSVNRRMGTTEEIADLTQFLASEASSYIIGETINAQGVPQIEESADV